MKKFLAAAAKRRGNRSDGVPGGGLRRSGNFNWNSTTMVNDGRMRGRVQPDDSAERPRPFIFGSDTLLRANQLEPEQPRRDLAGRSPNQEPPDVTKEKRKNNGDRLLTRAETYNMKLDRKDSTPFILMPRVSRAHDYDDNGPWDPKKVDANDYGDRGDVGRGSRGRGDSGDGDGGESEDSIEKSERPGKRPRRDRRRPEGAIDEEEGDWIPPRDGDPGGGPEAGGKTKFRRNVPPYYKIFELNSRFFLSGLGMISLLNIFLATVAVITGCQSDPAVYFRFPESHIHIAFLAIVLIILILKYCAYLFHMKNLNRRMEIAHILFFLVILITTGFYAHWVLNKLTSNVHNAYDIRLPCARSGSYNDKDQPAPVEQEENLVLKADTQETAIKNWYVCALIRSTYQSGIACIVFSCLLLCGLVANVIHAFLGIQNDVDITS